MTKKCAQIQINEKMEQLSFNDRERQTNSTKINVLFSRSKYLNCQTVEIATNKIFFVTRHYLFCILPISQFYNLKKHTIYFKIQLILTAIFGIQKLIS